MFFSISYISAAAWPLIKKRIRNKFPEVKQLSIDRLNDLYNQNSDFLLIDVRPASEFNISHLKQAINLTTAKEISLEIKKENKKILVLYCSVGYRSSAIAQKLVKEGYNNVFNLEGSIFEWVNSGNPVYRDKIRVKKVHPYNYYWGLLLKEEYREKI